jgi:hypothetical protein
MVLCAHVLTWWMCLWLFASQDGGFTWVKRDEERSWAAVAMDSTGSIMLAAVSGRNRSSSMYISRVSGIGRYVMSPHTHTHTRTHTHTHTHTHAHKLPLFCRTSIHMHTHIHTCIITDVALCTNGTCHMLYLPHAMPHGRIRARIGFLAANCEIGSPSL